MMGSTFIAKRVGAQIDAVLDENWRGTYDILVTSTTQDFGASSTSGLIDPHFVATAGQSAISLEQLEAIRAITGVEVAAPLGMVGQLRHFALPAFITIPDNPDTGESFLNDGLLARITATLHDTRGANDRVVSENIGSVGILKRPADYRERLFTDPFHGHIGAPSSFMPMPTNRDYMLGLGSFPELPSAVIAVDPIAEDLLLGSGQAQYLAPLLDLPQDRKLNSASHKWRPLVNRDDFLATSSDLEFFEATQAETWAIPLIIREQVVGSLKLRVDVEYVEIDPDGLPATAEELEEATKSSHFLANATEFVLEKDVSELTSPFAQPNLQLDWPGSSLPEEEGNMVLFHVTAQTSPELTGRPQYIKADSESLGDRPAFEVVPDSIVTSAGQTPSEAQQLADAATDRGQVQGYRQRVILDEDLVPLHMPLPLGQFSVTDLHDERTNLASYVPSGLYDGSVTTLEETGEPVLPNFSGLDFLTAPPGAFTDLAGGAQLRGEAPIDVVRVRVGEVANYSPENQEKIARIAAQIQGLGLQTHIVAGSSLQPVSVFVPDYWVEDGLTDLGWAQTEWTTMGAAVISEGQITQVNFDFAFTVLVVVLIGWIIVTVLQSRKQRAQVTVLTRLGWSKPRIVRYLAAPQVPSVVLVALTGIAMLQQASILPKSIIIGFVTTAVILAIVSVILALVLGKPRQSHKGNQQRRGIFGRNQEDITQLPQHAPNASLAISPRKISWRQLSRAPLGPVLTVLGTALLSAVVGMLAMSYMVAVSAAGNTRITQTLMQETTVPLVLLALSGVGTVAIVLVLGLATQRSINVRSNRILGRVGFDRKERWKILLHHSSFTALATCAVSLMVALWLFRMYPQTLIPPTLAMISAAVVILVSFATTTPQRIAPRTVKEKA